MTFLVSLVGALFLQNGIFESVPASECVVQIVNDSSNGMIVMNYMSPVGGNCPFSGHRLNYTRSSQNSYINDFTVTVDIAWIASCEPTVLDPTPCRAMYYDVSGALLPQVGDQIDFVDKITIQDSEHFEVHTVESWSRQLVPISSESSGSTYYSKR